MENDNRNLKNVPRFREICGEIRPDGVVFDLVESGSGDGVELLRSDGQNYKTGLQFQDGSTTSELCTIRRPPWISRLWEVLPA